MNSSEVKSNIYATKKISHALCLCEIYENVLLLSKGIDSSLLLELASNAHSIAVKYSCNSHSKACMIGECEDCTPYKILNVDGFYGKKDVKFFKWCRENKNMKKVQMTLKCDEAIEIWTSSVANLKQQIHRKPIQVFCLNSTKEDLKNTDVLLHVDFSESYKNVNQDEIQSAYFGQSLFSIFTAYAYTCTHREIRTISITVQNQMSTHLSPLCIHKIINHIEEKVGAFMKLYICSDGCVSQFRSRFVFSFLSHFYLGKEIEWHFNETHHGKGPMDDISGKIRSSEK